jgi:hypothetical protein
MRRRTKKKTDGGTIVLHWALVLTLILSTATGLRIAADGKGATIARSIQAWLPADNVWFLHIIAGVSLMVIAAAYPIYLSRAGLARRVRMDWTRIRSPRVRGRARWSGINVLLYRLLFSILAGLLISGLVLHRGFGGWLVDLHRSLMWLVLVYTFAHIVAHFAFGGIGQLLRVFRPTAIPPASVATFNDDEEGQPPRLGPIVSRRTHILATTGFVGALRRSPG